MSVIAGVLLTVAITPVVAMGGAATASAISVFENLPENLNPGELAQPSTLYAQQADGSLVEITQFYDQDRKMVGWDDISQFAKDAVVAEEDPRFYSHSGVDVIAASRAILQNVSGSGRSGASTVTMQYVRNVLIQEAYSLPTESERKAAYKNAMRQDMDRKLKEMRYAIGIEKKYSKDEILLGYLNIALFGRQIYGIEAAANYFFGKTAKDLTLAEAASLVATVNNPANLEIDIPENIPANKQRRDKILNSMYERGKITKAQRDEALATEVTPNITPRQQGCQVAEDRYGLGHFCDYVQRYIRNDKKFGKTTEQRDMNFKRGGYKIITSIDLDMQAAGLDAMHRTVPAVMNGINVGGASVSVEVGTGLVRAMVQNRGYSDATDDPARTAINYNTDYDYGGSSGFQVGSTFKPVTLAEWLRTGHSLRDIVNMNGRTVQEASFKASCMPGGVYGYGSFTFSNDNLGVRGNQPVLTAIAQSVNGGLVSMQQKMDLCETFKLAKALGIHRASKQTNKDLSTYGTTDLTMVPSNVYGGIDEIAPITMAAAYGAFAGNGTVCTPVPIVSITRQDGTDVPFTKSKCKTALEPDVAAGVAYALEYTVNNGLARHARSATGVPHLAKTGTTDDVVDNWTVGGSSKVITATWVGNAGPICTNPSDPSTCGRVSTMRFGNLMFADQTIWPAMMNVADRKYGGDKFPQPKATATQQTLVQVPDVRGAGFEQARQALMNSGFTVADGGEVDGSQPAGTVARTEPAAGASVPRGGNITLYRSNGQAKTVPDGIVGMFGNNAQSALHGAGFSDVRFNCAAGGVANPNTQRVVSSDPAPGTEANGNSRVYLTLSCS